MKKSFMVLAAVLSLGVSQLAMAGSCGIYTRVYQAPVKRIAAAAPFRRPVVRWIAWHRVHPFHRYF